MTGVFPLLLVGKQISQSIYLSTLVQRRTSPLHTLPSQKALKSEINRPEIGRPTLEPTRHFAGLVCLVMPPASPVVTPVGLSWTVTVLPQVGVTWARCELHWRLMEAHGMLGETADWNAHGDRHPPHDPSHSIRAPDHKVDYVVKDNIRLIYKFIQVELGRPALFLFSGP